MVTQPAVRRGRTRSSVAEGLTRRPSPAAKDEREPGWYDAGSVLDIEQDVAR